MHKYLVVAGLLLLAAGAAVAQDFPTVETAPAFMYIRTPVPGLAQDFNCAGGGGTIAYNFTSMLGIAADLGGCKVFGLNNTLGIGTQVTGNEFTYLFGPRLTFRRSGPIHPFFELNFGGARISVNAKNCDSSSGGSCSLSANAFAMTVGGGLDIVLSKKISLRPVQAEYMYTRFGNNCQFEVCNNNNSQNSFRLKSGIVIAWGGGS
jgi:opacity protein-like surface antigen